MPEKKDRFGLGWRPETYAMGDTFINVFDGTARAHLHASEVRKLWLIACSLEAERNEWQRRYKRLFEGSLAWTVEAFKRAGNPGTPLPGLVRNWREESKSMELGIAFQTALEELRTHLNQLITHLQEKEDVTTEMGSLRLSGGSYGHQWEKGAEGTHFNQAAEESPGEEENQAPDGENLPTQKQEEVDEDT